MIPVQDLKGLFTSEEVRAYLIMSDDRLRIAVNAVKESKATLIKTEDING